MSDERKNVLPLIRMPRENRLNDLANKEWMVETKSVWFSRPPARDKRKAAHPATFAETDVVRLIRFFTKSGQRVLDPFLGTGSTLLACAEAGRIGVGVELVQRWADVAVERLSTVERGDMQTVFVGDSRDELSRMEPDSFDFIVTSPPYWSILTKPLDHKTRTERASKGLETKYSEHPDDLGNRESYSDFKQALGSVFEECHRLLKPKKYTCVIVSDFRHKSEFVPFHSHISELVCSRGFALEGITILAQDSKNLYPYGIPSAFVSNIHHQYILVFRKRSR